MTAMFLSERFSRKARRQISPMDTASDVQWIASVVNFGETELDRARKALAAVGRFKNPNGTGYVCPWGRDP
jgi:hypothetical protein